MENNARKVREENAPLKFENFHYVMWMVTASSEICTYVPQN